MKIVDIDYYAVCGTSWLNKTPAKYKIWAVFLILFTVIFSSNYYILGTLYLFLLLILMFSNLPKFKMFIASLYPLVFIVLYVFSLKNILLVFFLTLIFKVLCATTAFVTLIFTTGYIEIFRNLEKFLPSFLVNILFLTYRSIFILWKTLENIQQTLYLRGGLNIKRPVYSMKILSNAIGYLIVKAMDVSENIYESMKIRGYSGSLKYLTKF